MASQGPNGPLDSGPDFASSLIQSYLIIDIRGLVPRDLTPETRLLLWEYFKKAQPGIASALMIRICFGTNHLLGAGLSFYLLKIALPKLIVPLFRLLKRDGPSGRELGSLITASMPLLAFIATSIVLVLVSAAWTGLRSWLRDPGDVGRILIMAACGVAPACIVFGDELRPIKTFFDHKIIPVLVAEYKKFRRLDDKIRMLRGRGLLWVLSTLSDIYIWSKRPLMRIGAAFIILCSKWGAEQPKQRFEHRKLKQKREIRLIKLARKSLFGGVNLRMKYFSLDEVPSYDAISYTWGDSKLVVPLIIDGLLYDVPQTAFSVLKVRQSFWRTRLLWIDSVCINQNDREEKGVQIGLMRDIYRNASRLVVCLGDGRDAHLVGGLLDELAMMKLGNGKAFLSERVNRRYLVERGSPRWIALRQLFSQPWFERIWVVQELAFAQRVDAVYGGGYLDWDVLVEVAGIFHADGKMDAVSLLQPTNEELSTTEVIAPAHALIMTGLRAAIVDGSFPHLAILLLLLQTFKATQEEDKVFALLGLAAPESYAAMGLEYRESFQQTYTRVASHMLVQENLLIFLNVAGGRNDRHVPSLPTWVPDWSTAPRAQPLALPDPGEDQYKAAGATEPSIRMGETQDSIIVAGIMLPDYIEKVGCICSGKRSKGKGFKAQEILSWHDEAYTLAQGLQKDPYWNDQPLDEAFWRTLIGDFDTTSTYRPAPTEYADCYQAWKKFMRAADPQKPFLAIRSVASDPSTEDHELVSQIVKTTKFNIALALCSEGRRLCVTKNGFMGLFPHGSKPGDDLCIFAGGQTPFVLRRISAAGDDQHDLAVAYELIGEAYIHGIMDGEMVPRDERMQDIRLF